METARFERRCDPFQRLFRQTRKNRSERIRIIIDQRSRDLAGQRLKYRLSLRSTNKVDHVQNILRLRIVFAEFMGVPAAEELLGRNPEIEMCRMIDRVLKLCFCGFRNNERIGWSRALPIIIEPSCGASTHYLALYDAMKQLHVNSSPPSPMPNPPAACLAGATGPSPDTEPSSQTSPRAGHASP